MSAQAASAIFDIPTPAAKPRARKKPAVATKTNGAAKTSGVIRLTRAVKPKTVAISKKAQAGGFVRTSRILRDILTKNPDLQYFTVEKIATEIGATSFGTSLMVFAIPEVIPIPIPGMSAIVVLPTGVISAQMVAGKRQVALPKFLLKRAVPRKALAAAIHAILPLLEKAEKVTKPRWKWATSPEAQRLLGAFIFLLALAIAFPIPGFNMPQAIAIFTIGLGLVEKDGVVICVGVVIGLASLLLLGGVIFGLSSFLGIGGA